MRITAVDISLPALESYRRNNPDAEAVRHGDILHLDDVAGGSFDGAYNLGVVEHFTQDQIVQILREMGRTVKPGGKVVIFWPHRRATSVFVLKMIHRLLDFFRRQGVPQVRLHPPEISLLKSRDQAREVVESAGFNLVNITSGCVTSSFKRSSSAASGERVPVAHACSQLRPQSGSDGARARFR